jgi:ubiquinol-cytochrome c reductase cytochrome b subunit
MRHLHGTNPDHLTQPSPETPSGGVAFPGGSTGRVLAVLTWWAFLIALVSGGILSFNYRPWGDVFSCLSKLTHQLPHGLFFHKLHYLSGQCFLFLALAHTGDHFLRKTYLHMRAADWMRLVAVGFLSFPLVFTGFILKGDKEGIFAGEVMVHLAREIPLVGSGLAALLLKPGEDFFLRPYLFHTVILPLLVIFLLGNHQRRLFPEGGLGLPLLAMLSIGSLFFPLPPDIPPRAVLTGITGPWFFQGIQLLLRYGPPLLVGVLWPMVTVLAVFALAIPALSSCRWLRFSVGGLWLAHLAVLCLAQFLLRGMAGG